ncbi:transposase family protein [Streptomyces sp. NBC_01497]|uniref:transposase family protein n=1 Tax=Streptomyces sp. NBC_01497 TaxID=2903885 RepID=UPI002E372425|nr:transposase family protein [Streptomyces sp. NBC_01497]
MTKKWARAALSHPAFSGVSRSHLVDLIDEMAKPWCALREAALHAQRGGNQLRAVRASPRRELVFTDRVVLTLGHLRTRLPHAAMAELYSVGRSTVNEAISEIRHPLALGGFAVPDRPEPRLRTPAHVFAYAAAEGVTLRIDGTETQIRRRRAHRPGRRAFVSGMKKHNTIKNTTISDGQGRTLWTNVGRPGPMHDQTAMHTEDIAEQPRLHPGVKTEVDEGYRGLAKGFLDQVSAPPKKPKVDVLDRERRAWREIRRHQSSRRIVVVHANAEMRHWRPLQRYSGHRETCAETHRAIAGLASDRAARCPSRPVHGTGTVLARPAVC